MSTLTNLPVPLLTMIATLRIQGTHWDKIAQTLAVNERELRTCLRQQRAEFQREMEFAKEELLADVFIECVAKLRQTMNSGNTKEEANAAKALLRTCETHQRLNRQANKNRAESPANKNWPELEPEPNAEPPTPVTTAANVNANVRVVPERQVSPVGPRLGVITPKTLHKGTLLRALRRPFSTG